MRSSALAFVLVLLGACKSTPHDPPPTPSAAPPKDTPTIVLPSASTPAPAETSGWVPFLYRIEGAHPSYLFGTIHVGSPKIATFPTVVDRDFAASDELVTEVVMDSGDKDAFARGMVLQGKTLDQAISPGVYARASATLSALGVPKAAWSHMKPWAVGIQISLIEHARDLEGGVDIRLTTRARSEKKPVDALETYQDQLDVFDKLSASEQETMLDETMTQRETAKKEGRDPIVELLDAYASGDEGRVQKVLDRDYDPKNPVDVKLRQRLVLDRNVTMEKAIAARVTAGTKSHFFAVGAAHVIGPDGIVARLRADHFTVERER